MQTLKPALMQVRGGGGEGGMQTLKPALMQVRGGGSMRKLMMVPLSRQPACDMLSCEAKHPR